MEESALNLVAAKWLLTDYNTTRFLHGPKTFFWREEAGLNLHHNKEVQVLPLKLTTVVFAVFVSEIKSVADDVYCDCM
jgi:hypothetical protein